MSARLTRLPPWLLSAFGALLWLAIDPPTPDLAAHEYRAQVVRDAGLSVWEQGWYAGHHLPGYSVLMPPLAALLSPQLVAAACAVIATACFAPLARSHWPGRAGELAALWFSLGAVSTLVGGQLAFTAGLAPALGALLAASRGRTTIAALLGAATTLTSPVAAALLALAAAAWWIADRRRPALAVIAGLVAPGLAIALAFPQGGMQPFAFSSFAWCFAAAIAIAAVLPAHERALRFGAVLYAGALVGAIVIDTPVGGNLVRLAAVFGGPLALGALYGHTRRTMLLALVIPLLYWQWLAPVRSVIRGAGDRSAQRSYHAPLISELDLLERTAGPARVEIPFTSNHWEARYVAPSHALARGWERQLDVKLNPLFYGRAPLTAATYRRWLDDLSVAYVALPDLELDPAGAREGALVRSGTVPGLRPLWHSAHWRLYRVAGARPLATAPATVTALGLDRVDLRAPTPATTIVRVRFTPYWALTRGAGCVGPAPGGWTRVRLRRGGAARLEVRFALARIRATSDRCSG